MPDTSYRYIIVGTGLTGASAIKGIRALDQQGSILLIGSETHWPYHRPPLSKDLWFGKKTLEKIYINKESFYTDNNVNLALGVEVVGIDPARKTVSDIAGNTHNYEKLLLATGAITRPLDIPGGTLDGVCYLRDLDGYLALSQAAQPGRSTVIIGGGFIGSEMAAALNHAQLNVTMVFPSPYLCHQVFPEDLAHAIQRDYEAKGITIHTGDLPVAIEKSNGRFVTRTKQGLALESDLVVVGVGISPAVGLAEKSGLDTDNGIVVNEYLQTANPDIYACGDNANFPYQALGRRMRVEHWDNALTGGKHVGRNMAGGGEPFTYMPYFYSDLFQFGYEGVGEVSSRLETFADWQREYDTGVIYYLKDGRVRGVMLCNVWEKVEDARELIRTGKRLTAEELRGAIK